MTKNKATSAKAWKKNKAPTGPAPLELPSGNTALVRRPGMESFLREGLIPNALVEPIMATVNANDPQAQAQSMDEMSTKLLSDPDALAQMLDLVDNVTVSCVVEPVITPKPIDPAEERDEELLYVDEVDSDDKMFIFSYVTGGTSDLARFREGVAGNVAALANGGKVSVPAKRATKSR